MPTSLPVRAVPLSSSTHISAMVAVVLAFAVLIVLTFDAPTFDQIGAAAPFPVADASQHRV